MKRIICYGALALVAGVVCLAAQQPAPAGRGAVAAPAAQAAPAEPSPEIKAVQAMVNARTDPDATIKLAEELVTGFPNSTYKELALTMEGNAYQQKNKLVEAQVAFERLLAVNPKSLAANMTLGELITQQTGDKDFDKEKKLGDAEKYLKAAMDVLNAGKPNPRMSDQDWEATKGVYSAEVHNDFGLVARFRKNYDVAVTEFQTAATLVKEPAYDARLADALQLAGKNKESIAVCDRLLADPQLHPTIKALVTQVRTNAVAASTPPAK